MRVSEVHWLEIACNRRGNTGLARLQSSTIREGMMPLRWQAHVTLSREGFALESESDLIHRRSSVGLATLIVTKVHLHILPTMNPDGFTLRRRGNANNIDLNRDFPDQVSFGRAV
ncbi:hypothetical protein ACLOJK_014931 [Asimina triloba]